MEAQTDALVRKQFFISNNNINKLERLCTELGKGVSAAKIVRDAIDAYDPRENMANLEQKALLELAHTKVTSLGLKTEKLSERTIDIDKRVVRLETIVEIAKVKQIKR